MSQLDNVEDIKKEITFSTTLANQRQGPVRRSRRRMVRKGLLISYKNRVYLLPTSLQIPIILVALHNQDHEGYLKTLRRIARDFYWKVQKRQVQDFVKTCATCHCHKIEQLQPTELL